MSGPRAPEPEPAPADRPTEASPSTAVPAALRDAQEVAARVSADEAAADAERARLAHEPLPVLEEGVHDGFALAPDEIVHATRPAAMLEERTGALPSGGTLYLTSHRLVHAGQQIRQVQLEDITETGVALERLLLVDLADGSDLAIEIDSPRVLRVQLAAARAIARERRA
ncbi:MAG TPA: hypothetical protein VFK61_07175 [Candidatus Limnocylindria bacterium]|nr:hypothetical protein [Candidatus Limnocylindria bacterium]